MQTLETLARKECVPCKQGTPPLKGALLESLREQLGGAWKVVDDHQLQRDFKFKNFAQALEFTNSIGAEAERQDHHPDIALAWGKVGVTLWTHSVGGLSENDFVMAARIEKLPRPA